MESGRHGQTGARKPGAIGFAALRGGQIVGEHTLIYRDDLDLNAMGKSTAPASIPPAAAQEATTVLMANSSNHQPMRTVQRAGVSTPQLSSAVTATAAAPGTTTTVDLTTAAAIGRPRQRFAM